MSIYSKKATSRRNSNDVLNSMLTLGLLCGLGICWRLALHVPALMPACFVLVSGIQVNLDLLQHEAAHRLLFSKRRWNDFFGQWLCSIPLFSDLTSYRRFHFAHHRYLGDLQRDPEIPYFLQQGFDRTRLPLQKLLWNCLLDLSGYHFLQYYIASFLDDIRGGRARDVFRQFLCSISVIGIAGVVVGARNIFLLWLLPMMTVRFFFLKIQSYADHIVYGNRDSQKIHVICTNALTRFFIFPLNSHLHMLHHIFPQKAWRDLPGCLNAIGKERCVFEVSGIVRGQSSLLDMLTK